MKKMRYFECTKCKRILKINQAKYLKKIHPPFSWFKDEHGCGETTSYNELNPKWVKENKSDLFEEDED